MTNYTRADLIKLIKELMGVEELPSLVNTQITNYIVNLDMNFKDIARTLVYWVEVKGQSLQPVYGIGIVPKVREEAARYFEKLAKDQAAQQAEAKKAVELEQDNIIFDIKSLSNKKRKVVQLDFNDISLGEEDDGEQSNN